MQEFDIEHHAYFYACADIYPDVPGITTNQVNSERTKIISNLKLESISDLEFFFNEIWNTHAIFNGQR